MSYNEEHIFQLILEKLSGDISEKDNEYLKQAAIQDANVRRCLEELEGARDVAGPDFMNDVHNERAWSNVLSLLHADQEKREDTPVPVNTLIIPVQDTLPEKSRTTGKWWMAAAITFLIAVSGYWLMNGKSSLSKGNGWAMHTPGIPVWGNVHLQMENGDTVSLSGNAGPDIRTGYALLHPEAGKLTFTPGNGATGWNTLSVPTGKDYQIVLSDGSTIHLNAFSRLRFPFSFTGEKREVFLEGEAFFDIAPNAAQPFIVHTPNTAVRVLGTSFNINAYSDSLVVTSLVQGSVMTGADGGEEMLLKPGMEITYRKGYKQKASYFDEATTLAWRKGEYTYYNQSLSSLGAILFHWYGMQLLFEDPLLADKMLTGVIDRNQSVTEFLESLYKTSGITYNITEDKIYLSLK
jgi:hypothetical protein